MLLCALLSILIALIALPAYKFFKRRVVLKKIPAPPEQFLLWHLYILTRNTDLLFKRIRKYSKRYYPIYRFSTPYVHVVHLLDPNDIELVLSSTKHLSKSKIYTYLRNWLGTGLLTSTGEKWHKRRKILTPAFHFNILQQFLTVFNEETSKLTEKLEIGTIDVVPPITNFTLQSIAETAMGLDDIDHGVQKKYKQAVLEMGKILLKRLEKPWFVLDFIYKLSALGRKEKRVVKVLHDFSNGIIKQRESGIEVESLVFSSKKKRLAMLDLLLLAKNTGADIDFGGIREEVDTFMFEGHDTTSMAISFILLVLANLQDVQTKVLEEILAVLGPSRVPSSEDLQELRYTERVIKETLRLFPSVPFISRYSSEEFTTTTGYTIPEGTILHLHIFDVHRNEQIYPDPLKFDPDRFLPENVSKRHPFAYIPFSAGPRNCIGQKFAFFELKAVLCGVLRSFKLKKVDDMNEVEFRPDLVLRPMKDIRVKVALRC